MLYEGFNARLDFVHLRVFLLQESCIVTCMSQKACDDVRFLYVGPTKFIDNIIVLK